MHAFYVDMHACGHNSRALMHIEYAKNINHGHACVRHQLA